MVLEGFVRQANKVPGTSLGGKDRDRRVKTERWPEKTVKVWKTKGGVRVESEPGDNSMEKWGRCLVGRVGAPEGTLMPLEKIQEWASKTWQGGGVELMELGMQHVGFIFPTKKMAEETRLR